MAILRWKRSWGWVAVCVTLACTVALLALVGSTAFDKSVARWAKGLLFLIGAAAVAATLLSSDGMPWRARTLRSWLAPKPIAIALIGVLTAFGTMTDALSLFAPRPTVESAPGAIETKIDAIKADVRSALPSADVNARVWAKLPGLWGEAGCDVVTYRFGIVERAVVVESVKRPPGTRPYRLLATIQVASGDKMEVLGEEPSEVQGSGARFTYATNGIVERLNWDDHLPNSPPVELVRCG